MLSFLLVLTIVPMGRLPSAPSAHALLGSNGPVVQNDWSVWWERTDDDGIRVYNVTYKGTLFIRDARVPGVIVQYYGSGCYFYDQFLSVWIPDSQIYVEDLSQGTLDPSDQGFQIRADVDVPGYDYQQIWRFLPDGRFLPLVQVGGGGCFARHDYEVRWKIDLAIGTDSRNEFLQYANGYWTPIREESEIVDNGQRDPARTYTNWEVAQGKKSYYFAPFDTPDPSWVNGTVLAVRQHPNEIENSESPGVVTPYVYLNGESIYRKDISIFYISKHFHDPFIEMVFATPVLTGLIFYPSAY